MPSETSAVPAGRAMTVIALDYGLRHIGVAVGNSLLCSAQPLAVVRARNGVPDWPSLAALLSQWRPERVIVGLPLNMDGTESPMSVRAARFARQIEGRFAVPVSVQDERLTSREAKSLLRESGDWRNTGEITADAEAAGVILADYWRSQGLAFTSPST